MRVAPIRNGHWVEIQSNLWANKDELFMYRHSCLIKQTHTHIHTHMLIMFSTFSAGVSLLLAAFMCRIAFPDDTPASASRITRQSAMFGTATRFTIDSANPHFMTLNDGERIVYYLVVDLWSKHSAGPARRVGRARMTAVAPSRRWQSGTSVYGCVCILFS